MKLYRWLVLPIVLTGCVSTDSSEPFVIVADVQQLMLSILEPAAEQYWDAVGWIDDIEQGTTEIRPESAEDWDAVRNAAIVVAESGNLLMMDGRALDDGPWIAMARSMTEVARTAITAAEARDEQGVFDAGAEIYYTCTACHSAYALDLVRPNAVPD